MKGAATKYGMQFTDGLGVSNTQPDYTATCVTFKQSGTTDVGIEGCAAAAEPRPRLRPPGILAEVDVG